MVEGGDDAQGPREAVVDVEAVGESGDQPGVLAVRRRDPQVVVGVWQWVTTTQDVALAQELSREGVAVEATDAVLVIEGKAGSDGVQVSGVTARVPGAAEPVELRGATSAEGVDPAAVDPPQHVPAPSGSPYAGTFAAVQHPDDPGTVVARSDLDHLTSAGAEDAARSLRTAVAGLVWAGAWSLVAWAVVVVRRRTERRSAH